MNLPDGGDEGGGESVFGIATEETTFPYAYMHAHIEIRVFERGKLLPESVSQQHVTDCSQLEALISLYTRPSVPKQTLLGISKSNQSMPPWVVETSTGPSFSRHLEP